MSLTLMETSTSEWYKHLNFAPELIMNIIEFFMENSLFVDPLMSLF